MNLFGSLIGLEESKVGKEDKYDKECFSTVCPYKEICGNVDCFGRITMNNKLMAQSGFLSESYN